MTTNQLQVIIEENQLENADEVKQVFSPFFDQVEVVKETCLAIKITDISQVEEMERAREYRLKLKNLRVASEKEKTRLKEQPLRKCQAIDALARYLKSEIEPLEDYLMEQEKFAIHKEEERKAELESKRKQELDGYEGDYQYVDLKEMPEENYQNFLKSAQETYKLKKEKEAQEEAERKRIADEQAKAQEAIRAENERLKAEADKREKEIEAERKKVEEANAKAQAEAEKKLKAEREKTEKLEAELKAKAEEDARAKREADAKAKAEQEAKEKAEKEAKLAPDKKKLEQLAVQITQLSMPEVASDEAKAIVKAVVELLNKTSNYIKEKTISL